MQPGTYLYHSSYILVLVLLYVALVLSAWSVISTLTFHPITTSNYGLPTFHLLREGPADKAGD
jgi:hypothetical protein